MSVNKVILVGRLGKDPELRMTASQLAVASFSVATNERKKDQSGNWTDHTEWHNIVVFGKTAQNCSQYIKKGSQVFVEGALRTRKWQDKEGKDRYTTEIVANTVQFLDSKKGGMSDNVESSSDSFSPTPVPDSVMASLQSADSLVSTGSATKPVTFDEDDIPF
jgi:single-strand DNA-binding protein